MYNLIRSYLYNCFKYKRILLLSPPLSMIQILTFTSPLLKALNKVYSRLFRFLLHFSNLRRIVRNTFLDKKKHMQISMIENIIYKYTNIYKRYLLVPFISY